MLKIHLSNQAEKILEELKQQLYLDGNPFARRLLIVPSPAMKAWVMQRLADETQLGIVAGLNITFLEAGLQQLYRLLNVPISHENQEPSELELAFTIESIIYNIIAFDQERSVWKPLLDYIATTGNEALSLKQIKRISSLAKELASLFQNYGRYGGGMVREWQQQDVHKEWQAVLWKELEQHFSPWNYPYKKYEAFEINSTPANGIQVHLFGLSYLSPLQHRFFTKISESIPTHLYMISPCQQFWSDIVSDKERKRLLTYWEKQGASAKQQETLEKYLKDTNPLLANFGRLGREMAKQFDDALVEIEETYSLSKSIIDHPDYDSFVLPDSNFHPSIFSSLTLLEGIQSDLTLLRSPRSPNKIEISSDDMSLQVHAAPSISREVETIYDVILSIIQRHSADEHSITPSDVLVMTPRIKEYAPFVQQVFGAPDSLLQAEVMDSHAPISHPFIQAFYSLLQLGNSRWDISSWLSLLELPVFSQRHDLSQEDLILIREWLLAADVRWGKDAAHRDELLKLDHSTGLEEGSDKGTWDMGLGRLLEGMAMSSHDSMQGMFFPLEAVESSQGTVLGTFIRLFYSLLSDLKVLSDQKCRPIKEWMAYLKCLVEAYLDDGFEYDEERLELFTIFGSLEKAARQLKEATFPFISVMKHVEEALNTPSLKFKESNLQAVRFCSLLPMRALPAKVVILAGMDDEHFPGSDKKSSLNMLQNRQDADYYPSQVEWNRYLFLESLLASRGYFVMTYCSQQPGETHELLPSLFVTELMNYVDRSFALKDSKLTPSKHCFYKHPLTSFHHSYFETHSKFKSFSLGRYQAAKSHYKSKDKMEHCFIKEVPHFDLSLNAADIRDTLKLSELTSFSRNPVRRYFNKVLGIYLNKDDNSQVKNEDSLLLDALTSSMFIKDSVNVASPHHHIRYHHAIPAGPFKEMEIHRVTSEVEKIRSTLHEHGLAVENLFEVEFNLQYEKPDLSANCMKLPSLCVEVNGKQINIVGQFELVSPEGLVVFIEDKLDEVIKIWPMILIFCALIKQHALSIKSNIIFIKKGTFSIKDGSLLPTEKLLTVYLEYFYKTHNLLSPLHPDWVGHILKADATALQEKMSRQDDFQPIYDEYLKWMQRSAQNIDHGQLVEKWHPTAQDLFVDVQNAWYAKRRKEDKESTYV